MVTARDFYLDQLKRGMGGDPVKVVTGVRRCGKSFLLFNLFRDYLLGRGVKESHIIGIALDDEENKPLCNLIALAEYIRRRIGRLKGLEYLFIDEIQLCYKALPQGLDLSRAAKEDRPSCHVTFYDVLNEFRKRKDVDVYVTILSGEDFRLLSSICVRSLTTMEYCMSASSRFCLNGR